MNAAELLKFSQEGGIGTCISKIEVPSGSEKLPCKAGDIITILKPVKDRIYLGSIQDVVGHFEMDDVSLIYLNLSSTSPRKNPEKYMSFTALLDQKVPTGSLLLKDPSPFSGPSSLESSPNTILEEVEPVKSMEELDTHISKPVSIPSTEDITPSIPREAPELAQSIPVPEKS
ncbi:hypothetical protein DSO57_1007748 [Entomophthora muscae]|uniref:Uncharacterized protein n=1 Tax=Entomophthora muscae TaxID=34485 RepID=A0ACC2UGY2_9FUNG|nr:hypothetical protein DSO57_1007748 [Entomophthora muscae]